MEGKENQQQEQQQQNNDGMRVFTQEQMNKIISQRLQEEKAKNAAALVEREKALEAREIELDARALLAEKHLPQDLLPAINCKDKETMENSVKILVDYMLRGKAPASGGGFTETKAAGIRKAMGL